MRWGLEEQGMSLRFGERFVQSEIVVVGGPLTAAVGLFESGIGLERLLTTCCQHRWPLFVSVVIVRG